jgi:hypothetical protein
VVLWRASACCVWITLIAWSLSIRNVCDSILLIWLLVDQPQQYAKCGVASTLLDTYTVIDEVVP